MNISEYGYQFFIFKTFYQLKDIHSRLFTDNFQKAVAAHLGAEVNEYSPYTPCTNGLPHPAYTGNPCTHDLYPLRKRDAEEEAAEPYWTPAVFTASGTCKYSQ